MSSGQKLKVALIEPPIVGHKFRGTGIYTERLYNSLKQDQEVAISLVNLKADLESFNLVHYPYFDPFFLTLPFFKKKPRVVTVHDLIPLVFPKFFPVGVKGSLKWKMQKYALVASNVIITDSYASKKDIVEITGITEKKIHVIYLGVGEEFRVIKEKNILEEITKRLELPQDFILHVGDVNYNKNIPNLIKAFKMALQSYPNLNLVLIGQGFITASGQLSELLKLVKFYQLENKVYRMGYVKLNDLVGIYNLAKVYLQPSFAEGFGLPVIEAMTCGCPVVVSNVSSLPEIVADCGIKVNPGNETEIAEGVVKILSNNNLYKSLSERGLKRVKNFSWEKCAIETIKTYKQVIG